MTKIMNGNTVNDKNEIEVREYPLQNINEIAKHMIKSYDSNTKKPRRLS